MVNLPTWVWIATGAAAFAVALGEAWHGRRVRRVARLAFGPDRRPAAWTRGVPLLRAAAAGSAAWGLATLAALAPKVHAADDEPIDEKDVRHCVLVLDVSPSMRLEDAGPSGTQSRASRAQDVVDSLFERVSIGRYRVSIIAVYNGAKAVVVDTEDSEVVNNILGDLPLHYAFRAGKTTLFAGLEQAVEVAKPWPRDSTLLVLVSDGDTVPATGMPPLPPSIAGALVIGVGDPMAGAFIDGRQSRQDVSTLRQIAARLGGAYHNGNQAHVPTATLANVAAAARPSPTERLGLREYALLAAALGSAVLALVPLLLQLAGTRWRPGVVDDARALAAGRRGSPPTRTSSTLRPGRRVARPTVPIT